MQINLSKLHASNKIKETSWPRPKAATKPINNSAYAAVRSIMWAQYAIVQVWDSKENKRREAYRVRDKSIKKKRIRRSNQQQCLQQKIVKNGQREYQHVRIQQIKVWKKLLKHQIIHKQKDKNHAIPDVIKLWIKWNS